MDIERPWTFSAAFEMNGKKLYDVCGMPLTKVLLHLIGKLCYRMITSCMVVWHTDCLLWLAHHVQVAADIAMLQRYSI